MSDNFFEETTEAAGFLYTIFALCVLAAILIWG